MRGLTSWTVITCAFVLQAWACSSYDVRLVFSSPDLRSESTRVEVSIIESCIGQELGAAPREARRSVQFEGNDADALGEIDPGSHGLYARTTDSSCRVIAAGCTPIDVSAGGSGTLRVELNPVAGECAPELCACGGVDAGSGDGSAGDASGPDAEVRDAATDDTNIDAPLDAAPADTSCNLAAYAETVLADAPLLYFRFEEVVEGSLVDEVRSLVGRLDGTPIVDQPSAYATLGRAVDLPTAPNAASFRPADVPSLTEFTVELWARLPRPLASGETPRNLFLLEDFRVRGFRFWDTSQGPQYTTSFGHPGTEGDTVTASARLPSETWFHVVLTVNSSFVRVYVDGEPTLDAPAPLLEPGGATAGSGEFQGVAGGFLFDEFAIYDVALTSERVIAHYAAATACE